MSDEIAEEVAEETPAWVKEGTEEDDVEIPGEDVSGASSGSFEDYIEPAKGVTLEITKALIDTYTPEGGDWKTRSLKLYLKVDKNGVDGKGRYAGKMFFPRMTVAVNRGGKSPDGKPYDFSVNAAGKPTTWYQPKTGGAFGDYNETLTALEFPNNPAPVNNKAFRDSLLGRKLVADITKKHRQVKDGNKYVDVPDEFENDLTKYRAAKVVVVSESATEAAVA